jgi:hypothetical protein
MSGFDRFCAVLAGLLGALLIILGALGLFFGSKANFALPPVLGVIPAFVGWGIVRSILVSWNVTPDESANDNSGAPGDGSPSQFGNWGEKPDDEQSG